MIDRTPKRRLTPRRIIGLSLVAVGLVAAIVAAAFPEHAGLAGVITEAADQAGAGVIDALDTGAK